MGIQRADGTAWMRYHGIFCPQQGKLVLFMAVQRVGFMEIKALLFFFILLVSMFINELNKIVDLFSLHFCSFYIFMRVMILPLQKLRVNRDYHTKIFIAFFVCNSLHVVCPLLFQYIATLSFKLSSHAPLSRKLITVDVIKRSLMRELVRRQKISKELNHTNIRPSGMLI